MSHGILGIIAFVIGSIILFTGDLDHERTRDAFWGFMMLSMIMFVSDKIQTQIKKLEDKL